jgi:hypothetical protein
MVGLAVGKKKITKSLRKIKIKIKEKQQYIHQTSMCNNEDTE